MVGVLWDGGTQSGEFAVNLVVGYAEVRVVVAKLPVVHNNVEFFGASCESDGDFSAEWYECMDEMEVDRSD